METKKQEQIKREAKELLAKFAKKLESVKFTEKKEKEEVGGFREEGEGLDCDKDFRERMFKNAPGTDGDFILAEKKKW